MKEQQEAERNTELFDNIAPDTRVGESPDSDFLAEARKINPDIVAWLTIPDTEIDFPIVQCEDNEYYLDYDFEKNYSYMGCPFLDYRCSSDFSDFNSIIYGHNISNKYMFYPLLNFKNSDYFSSHEYGTLTLSDKQYRINFIACDVIPNDDFAYNVIFLSQHEREVFLKTVKEKAVQQRDFDIEQLTDSQIITLSTCSYEFTNARTVLFGYLSE
jgi:sortase B